MKNIGLLLCFLLIGKGLPAGAQDHHIEVFGEPEDYDYDDYETPEEEIPDVKIVVPFFTVLPQVFEPVVGETISLPCTSNDGHGQILILNRWKLEDPSSVTLIAAGDKFLGTDDKRISVEGNVYTIKNVKKSDSGFYDCKYQYGDLNPNVTHTVNVRYQPNIKHKQRKIEVTKGSTATLNCRATGNPAPRIVWSKENGDMPSGAEQEEGLSITFEDVDRHYGGSYTCTADNGVGNAATAMRQIVVFYSPEIRTENEMVHTGNGDRVELVCIVHAHPTAQVTWTHNDEPVDSATTAEVQDEGHRHLLTIEQVSDQDIGHYSCQAVNDLGNSTEDINLTDAPSTPSITSDPHSAEEDAYTLTWTTDSYYPITEYQLMYRRTKVNESTGEPGQWVKISEEPEESEQEGVVRTFRQELTDLARATDYDAQLTISNSVKAAEQVNFAFSTRKVPAKDHMVGGSGRVTASFLQQGALTLVPLASLFLLNLLH